MLHTKYMLEWKETPCLWNTIIDYLKNHLTKLYLFLLILMNFAFDKDSVIAKA